MPTFSSRALALAPCVLLAACAVATAPGYIGPDLQPTNHTQSRQQYRGFSVRPPMGSGWTVRVSEQVHEHAVYRRTLATKTHTFVASVGLVQLAKALKTEDALVPSTFADSERYQVLENSHQSDDSRKMTCIRYSIRLRDKRAPNSPDADLVLIDRGLVCAHPTFPGMAIRASYSERGLEGELDSALWTDFEEFLRGVQIESAPGVPAA